MNIEQLLARLEDLKAEAKEEHDGNEFYDGYLLALYDISNYIKRNTKGDAK